jgi:hypothetical protein
MEMPEPLGEVIALIEILLAGSDEFGPEFDSQTLGDWAALHVYLPQKDIQSAITPPFMEAFLELQKQVYQLAALAKSGVADVGQLSELDRLELQINVTVSGGSSDYVAQLKTPLTNLLKRMIGKMTGRQATIVILGLATLAASSWSFNAWLEERRVTQIEELRSKDHIEALKTISFAEKEHTETFDKLVAILEAQGEVGKRALDVIQATNEALLKAAAKTPTTFINNFELKRSDAELLRVSPKKKPETKIVKQRIRVVDINTSDQLDLNLVLMDPDTNVQHRIKFTDSLFAGPDRHKLFEALEKREAIWVELALKEISGEIKSVQLLRCVDRPTEAADAEE